MHNAALHHCAREDGGSAFFKAADTIHGDETNVLYSPVLDFIENLHPGMLTFRFVDPDTQDILFSIDVIPKDDVDSLLL